MEREEANPHIIFLSGKIHIDYRKDENTRLIWIIVKKDDFNEVKEYSPRDFLHFLLMGYTHKMDIETEITKRVELIHDAKIRISHCIESFKEQIKKCDAINEDNVFIEIYNKIDNIVERAKMDLDIETIITNRELAAKQIKLSDNQIKANELSKITSVSISAFTLVAAIYYGFELVKDLVSDCNPNKKLIEISVIFLLGMCGIGLLLLSIHQWLRKDKIPKP